VTLVGTGWIRQYWSSYASLFHMCTGCRLGLLVDPGELHERIRPPDNGI
jgi:hypothetical protein